MDSKEFNRLATDYEMGEHAQEFMKSALGRYLGNQAQSEIDALRDNLETEQEIDKIREIQLEIAARRLCFRWIKEAIDNGHIAGEQLQLAQTED